MYADIELTIQDYLEMCEWWQSLPPAIRELVRRFPPGSKWHIRRQQQMHSIGGFPVQHTDWFVPESFTGTGCIRVRQISGDSGSPLAMVHTVRPVDLVPAGS